MFKNIKLGAKIGLGFLMLLVLACLLGGMAVLNMKKPLLLPKNNFR